MVVSKQVWNYVASATVASAADTAHVTETTDAVAGARDVKTSFIPLFSYVV